MITFYVSNPGGPQSEQVTYCKFFPSYKPDHDQQLEGEPSGHRVSMAVQLGGKGVGAAKLRGAHLWPVEHHHIHVS